MAAAAVSLDTFGAVFGEAKPERALAPASPSPRPVLFHAHVHSAAALRVVATDLHSLAWDRFLSVAELDDLVGIPPPPLLRPVSDGFNLCAKSKRDDVGIGGSWSNFLDYPKSSLSSGEVKLLVSADQRGNPPGPDRMNLVATKAKGLPRIAISLLRVRGSEINDVVANFSLALYAAYRISREDASKEQERVMELMASLSFEKEKNGIMQQQLEALSFLDKRKIPKPNLVADQVPSVSGVAHGSHQVIVPMQQHTPVASPSKVPPAKPPKRVAPMSRRARVRGALLHDTEENDDDS